MFIKIIRYPLVRLIAAFFLIIVAFSVVQIADGTLTTALNLEGQVLTDAITTALVIIFVGLVYWLYVRLWEGRPATELSASHAIPEIFVGLLVGAGFISAVMAVLYAMGHVTFGTMNDPSVLLLPMFMAMTSGFWEEILLRGVVFRICEEWLGSWIALAISAALFGAMHLGNENATLLAGAAIAIEAGILLGAIYMVTRRLWVAIGVHAGWNFTLGGIYGGAVSGYKIDGLLNAKITGPDMISGGPFGVEASLVTVVLGTLLALYFLMRARQKGHFIAPPWSRTKPDA